MTVTVSEFQRYQDLGGGLKSFINEYLRTLPNDAFHGDHLDTIQGNTLYPVELPQDFIQEFNLKSAEDRRLKMRASLPTVFGVEDYANAPVDLLNQDQKVQLLERWYGGQGGNPETQPWDLNDDGQLDFDSMRIELGRSLPWSEITDKSQWDNTPVDWVFRTLSTLREAKKNDQYQAALPTAIQTAVFAQSKGIKGAKPSDYNPWAQDSYDDFTLDAVVASIMLQAIEDKKFPAWVSHLFDIGRLKGAACPLRRSSDRVWMNRGAYLVNPLPNNTIPMVFLKPRVYRPNFPLFRDGESLGVVKLVLDGFEQFSVLKQVTFEQLS